MLSKATGLLRVKPVSIRGHASICQAETYVTITTMKFQILGTNQYNVQTYQTNTSKPYQLPVVEIALAGARILSGVISAVVGQSSMFVYYTEPFVSLTGIQPSHS